MVFVHEVREPDARSARKEASGGALFPAIVIMNMRRRTFLKRGLLAGSACAFPACHRSITKADVLRALIEQVVRPNTAAVARDSQELDGALGRFTAHPALTTLQTARQRWQRALLSWKRADAFRAGPIMDSNSLLRALFWPVRTGAIDALLQGSQAIDDASIDAMGVDRRGLFALEHLLHSSEPDEQLVAAFVGPNGERRARLARALAGNVSLHAQKVTRALGNGKKYADEFAAGGQDSLNRLVAQLVYTVESVTDGRLGRILGLAKSGQLTATEVEGGRSRMSQQIALSYLQASEQLYLGVDAGLSQLLKMISPGTDQGLRAAFSRAIHAVADLGLPLEEVAARAPASLEAAADASQQLERALKTDLASTLGVTLTFSSTDGD